MAGSSNDPWDRIERRVEHVERELEARRDHAHQLELDVRTLRIQVASMNDRMTAVLDGVKSLDHKLEVHQEQETERRVTEIEHREKEYRANARFRITTIISVLSVLVVVVQMYFAVKH